MLRIQPLKLLACAVDNTNMKIYFCIFCTCSTECTVRRLQAMWKFLSQNEELIPGEGCVRRGVKGMHVYIYVEVNQ